LLFSSSPVNPLKVSFLPFLSPMSISHYRILPLAQEVKKYIHYGIMGRINSGIWAGISRSVKWPAKSWTIGLQFAAEIGIFLFTTWSLDQKTSNFCPISTRDSFLGVKVNGAWSCPLTTS
jgi:hypothetical protein